MDGMKEVHIVVAITLDPRNPKILYAGTTGGVYRSTDGAATWEKMNKGLIPETILEAAMALGVNLLERRRRPRVHRAHRLRRTVWKAAVRRSGSLASLSLDLNFHGMIRCVEGGRT